MYIFLQYHGHVLHAHSLCLRTKIPAFELLPLLLVVFQDSVHGSSVAVFIERRLATGL